MMLFLYLMGIPISFIFLNEITQQWGLYPEDHTYKIILVTVLWPLVGIAGWIILVYATYRAYFKRRDSEDESE